MLMSLIVLAKGEFINKSVYTISHNTRLHISLVTGNGRVAAET